MVASAGGDFSAGLEEFVYEGFADPVGSAGNHDHFISEIGGHRRESLGKPTLKNRNKAI